MSLPYRGFAEACVRLSRIWAEVREKAGLEDVKLLHPVCSPMFRLKTWQTTDV